MVGFIVMIAGVLGLYAKGNAWARSNSATPDPVLTEVQSLGERFSGLETYIHDLDRRVTNLETKGN